MTGPGRRSDILSFYKTLAEPARLRIAGRLVGGAASLAELVAEPGIAPRDCARQLARLVDLGLVREEASGGRGRYRLDQAWLRIRSEALLDSPRTRALVDAVDERGRVLASFMRDGRLLGIPTGDARKLIVLAEVCRRFEAERTYAEHEVNAILSDFAKRRFTHTITASCAGCWSTTTFSTAPRTSTGLGRVAVTGRRSSCPIRQMANRRNELLPAASMARVPPPASGCDRLSACPVVEDGR